MTIKEQINAEYVSAFKNRETVKKNLLGVIKGEITTIEKNSGTDSLSDAEVTKLLLKYKKNVEENRRLSDSPELIAEQEIVEGFLPKQMTTEEIRKEVAAIYNSMPDSLPENAKVGKTMGEFNKRHTGKADSKEVMSVINQYIHGF